MTQHADRFAIERIEEDVRGTVEAVLKGIDATRRIGDSVFIKPNFTYPRFKPGVTTTREVIAALVEVLKESGCSRICLGEGEGGYNSFVMENTFENYQLGELTKLFGLEVVNVRKWPGTDISLQTPRGDVTVQVPRPLFDEFDSFITIPVPKVHSMTTISGAVKNQWGLLQDPMRLQYHYFFSEIVCALNAWPTEPHRPHRRYLRPHT